jgi:hypothetical protein
MIFAAERFLPHAHMFYVLRVNEIPLYHVRQGLAIVPARRSYEPS